LIALSPLLLGLVRDAKCGHVFEQNNNNKNQEEEEQQQQQKVI
jgi:hypothetical protein